jgi:hypothetical protein
MPTLEIMRADVLVEADLQQGQVDDAVVDRYLNEELGELHELIVQAYEGYFSTSANFTLSAGEDAEDLPVDFYQATDLEDLSNPTSPASLDTFEFKDRNEVPGRGWCIHGGQVLVRPAAAASTTYRLTYVPAFQDLDPDDSFTVPNNWHVYAVLGAAIRLRADQELAAGSLEDRRKAIAERIANATRKRKGPRKVRDVRVRVAFRRRSDERYNG